MTVLVKNLVYPALGNVTLTYSDTTNETKNITTLGDTYYDITGSRTPVNVQGLGYDFALADLPQPITYPNSQSGECALSKDEIIAISWE